MYFTKPVQTILLFLLVTSCVQAEKSPVIKGTDRFNPGVVIYFNPNLEKFEDQLQAMKRDGFRMVAISSWIWTVPKPGSNLEKQAKYLADWCDANDMDLLLHHNIQYGGGELGDPEKGYMDAAGYVRPNVEPWINVLKGHKSLIGVELGNEVGPRIPGDPAKAPEYYKGFRNFLLEKHGSLEGINKAWGTNYESLEEIAFIDADQPGRIDLHRFARKQFGRFYGDIFDKLFKPALGKDLIYTTKTSPDPYIYADFPSATVAGWDDLVANQPLWTLKLLADTCGRPTFNSEIHLYHDNYQYFPSVELTRYRYLTDALMGQWINASFAWGGWNKEEIRAIHSKTPATLNEINRLSPDIRPFINATAKSKLAVLVTEPLYHEKPLTQSPLLEKAYAVLAATGRPWRFVLDIQLAERRKQIDTLVCYGLAEMPEQSIKAVLNLAKNTKIYWVGAIPSLTEYGQPLSPALVKQLQDRVVNSTDQTLITELKSPGLPDFYSEQTTVSYGWWGSKRGHFKYDVQTPRVEARQTKDKDGHTLVTLINHTKDSVILPGVDPLPWLHKDNYQAYDVTFTKPEMAYPSWNRLGDKPALRPETEHIVLRPLDIRFYRYLPADTTKTEQGKQIKLR